MESSNLRLRVICCWIRNLPCRGLKFGLLTRWFIFGDRISFQSTRNSRCHSALYAGWNSNLTSGFHDLLFGDQNSWQWVLHYGHSIQSFGVVHPKEAFNVDLWWGTSKAGHNQLWKLITLSRDRRIKLNSLMFSGLIGKLPVHFSTLNSPKCWSCFLFKFVFPHEFITLLLLYLSSRQCHEVINKIWAPRCNFDRAINWAQG